MWLPVSCSAVATPSMAALSDSVPPPVNTTSLARQFNTEATRSRASSKA